MTLRTRLFLIIAGLAALLVLAQWWWTRKLTRELSDEIDAVASTVGHSVASFFVDGDVRQREDLVWQESILEERQDGGTETRHRTVRVF
ncbi:MAG: hypothetical protein V3T72_04045, partial [Thermoanaerobaculia bacterium]